MPNGYDRARGVWQADGSQEELHPEDQGQEKFSTHSDFSGGNQRVHRWRNAQRRASYPDADRQAFGIGDDDCAERREGNLRASRLWFLLLGGGAGLPETWLPVHRGGPKTPRLLEELKSAHWKRSPHADADRRCEFWHKPQGRGRVYRFIVLRYEKKPEPKKKEEPEQYQLFDILEYRVFVTCMDDPIDVLVWSYLQWDTGGNLIKEANNDAGWRRIPPSAGP
jgi:hypothetical protein